MRFINRLCIFLLGFVMGIVGCVGGLVGGAYYAYSNLTIEDFTGVLTKDDIPVLDEDAKENFTQLSMQEIIIRFLGMMSGEKGSLTIENIEMAYGLDLSMLNLPENFRKMPLEKLLGDEKELKEALSYITLGAVAELLSKTFGITFLDENYPHLFLKDGKLYDVPVLDLLDGGYVEELKIVYLSDLVPATLEFEENSLVKVLVDAIGGISLGELLDALINGNGDVLEIILNHEGVKNLALSDLIPEDLAPIAALLEGITLGDLVYLDEEGNVVFSLDALLEKITVRKVLGILELFDITVEELLDKLPEGGVKDQLEKIIDMTLKEIIENEDIAEFIGDITFGDLVDFVLGLIGQENLIADLPHPIPVIWEAVAGIGVVEFLDALEEGTVIELLEDAIAELTLDDLLGYYINEECGTLPQPVVALWYALRDITLGDLLEDAGAALLGSIKHLTLGMLVGGYFFEVETVYNEETEEYEYLYTYDEEGNRVKLLPGVLCALFEKIEDYTVEDYYNAYLCTVGECEHENEEDCFTLMDLLGETIYQLTLGEIIDEFLRDENGELIIPECLVKIYQAIMKITIGDIIGVITGEEDYTVLLEDLLELCLNDILETLIDFSTLPQIVKNIYDKIAFISFGDIIEDYTVLIKALMTLNLEELIGEFIPEDNEFINFIFDLIKYISIQDVIDTIETGDWRELLESVLEVKISELIRNILALFMEELDAWMEAVIGAFGDKTIGNLLDAVMCTLGNCEGEPHYDIVNFLEDTLFKLTFGDFLTEEFKENHELIYHVFASVSLGSIFYLIMCLIGCEEYCDNETLIDIIRDSSADLTVKELFGSLLEDVELGIPHPIPFFILALADIQLGRIYDLIEGKETNWLDIVEIVEDYFFRVAEDKTLLGLKDDEMEDLVYGYVDTEHPVSFDFLFGWLVDEILEAMEENQKLHDFLAKLVEPLRDFTLREFVIDYRHFFDQYNEITMGELFSILFDFTFVNGRWENENVSDTVEEFFNRIADYTVYDFFYGLVLEDMLRNIRISDIFMLIVETTCLKDWYDNLTDEMKRYLNCIMRCTIGDIVDGKVTLPDWLIDCLGDLTIWDALSLIPGFEKLFWKYIGQFVENYDGFRNFVKLIFSIKIIHIIEGNWNAVINDMYIIDFIYAVCQLFGTAPDRSVELIDKLLDNIKDLTFGDVFGLTEEEYTFEDIINITLEGITIGMVIDALAHWFLPESAREEYDTLVNTEVARAIFGIIIINLFYADTVEGELEALYELTLGDILEFGVAVDSLFFDVVRTAELNALIERAHGYTVEEYVEMIEEGDVDTMEAFLLDLLDMSIYDAFRAFVVYYDNLTEGKISEIDEFIQEELFKYMTPTYILDGFNIGMAIVYDDYIEEFVKAYALGYLISDVLTYLEVKKLPLTVLAILIGLVEVTVGDIIDIINGEKDAEYIAEETLGNVSIAVILFDIIVYPYINEDMTGFVEGGEEALELFEELLSIWLVNYVAQITVYDIIFNTEDVIEYLRAIGWAHLIDLILYFVWEERDYQLALFVLMNNLARVGIIGTFEGEYTVEEIIETAFDGITLGLVADTVAYYVEEDIDSEIKALDIYEKIADVEINEIIFDQEAALEKAGEVSVQDIIQLILFILGIEEEFDSKTLTKLYENAEALTINYFLSDEFTVQDMLRKLLDGLTIGMIIDDLLTFAEDEELVSGIQALGIYQKATAVLVLDLIYDIDAALVQLGTISVKDVIELVLFLMGEEDEFEYETLNALYHNTEALTINYFMSDEFTAEDMVKKLLAGITFGMIIDDALTFVEDEELALGIKELGIYTKVAPVLVVDVIFLAEEALEQLGEVSLKDVFELILFLLDKDTTFEAQTLNALYNNSAALTINYFMSEECTFEDAFIKLFNGIDLGMMVEDLVDEFAPEADKDAMMALDIYEKVEGITVNELVFDNEEALEQLGTVSVNDVIELILFLMGKDTTFEYEILTKLYENAEALTINYFMSEEFTAEDALIKLLDGISVGMLVSDIILMTDLDEEKAEIIRNIQLIIYSRNIYFTEIIDGSFNGEEFVDGIMLWYFVDLVSAIMKLSGNSDVAEYIDAFTALIDEGSIGMLRDAMTWEDVIFVIFGTSTLGELFAIITETEIADLESGVVGEKLALVAPVRIAMLITNFIPETLFRDTIVADFIGEEMGWTFDGTEWDAGNLSELANKKVADLINELLSFIPAKLRLPVFFLVAGIAAYLVYLIYEESIDSIFGEYIPEEIKATEFYQALATISLKNIIEDTGAIERIKALTWADLYRFIVTLIDIFVDIDKFIASDLLTKLESNIDDIKLLLFLYEGEEDKFTYDRILHNITIGDVIEFVLLILDEDLSELKEGTKALVDKLMANFDRALVIDLVYGHVNLKVILKDIALGDLFNALYDYVEAPSQDVLENGLYKRVAAILILDLIYNLEEVLKSFFDVTLGEIAELIALILGEEISQKIKDLGVYKALGSVTIKDLVEDHENLWNKVGAISIADIIELICFIVHKMLIERVTSLSAYNKLASVTLNDIFCDHDSLVQKAGSVSVADIVEVIYACFDMDVPEDFKALDVYTKVWDITIYDMVKNTNGALDKFYSVTVDDILDLVFYLAKAEMPARLLALNAYQKLASINMGDIFAGHDSLVQKAGSVSIADIIEVIYACFDMDVPEEVKALSVYEKIGNITIYEAVKQTNVALKKVYAVSIRDLIEIVELFTEIWDYDEFNDLMENLEGIFIGDIVFAVENASWKPVVREALDGIQILIFTLNPAVEKLVPSDVERLDSYQAIANIYLLDLIYFNEEAVLTALDGVIIGEIVEFVLIKCDVSYKDYVLTIRIISNLYNLSVRDLIELPIEEILAIVLDGITVSDVIETILAIVGVDVDELEEGTKALVEKVLENLSDVLVVEMFDEDVVLYRELLEGITIGMLLNVLYDYVTAPSLTVRTTVVYRTVDAILVLDIIDNTEAVLEKILALTLGDILDFVLALIGDYALEPRVKATNLYKKIAGITLDEIFNNFESVKRKLSYITLYDIVEFIGLFVELPSYPAFNTLLDNFKKVNLISIFKAIENSNFEPIIRTALLNVDLSIVTDFPAIAEIIPADIDANKVFRCVEAVKLIDIIYGNWKAVYENFADLTLGEIVDFVEVCLDKSLGDEVKALSLYKKLARITVRDIVEDHDSLLEKIYYISLYDLIEVITLFTELPDYNEFNDLMLNSRKITVKLVIKAAETGNFEYLVRTLLVSIDFSIFTDIPEVSEAIEDKIEFHNVFLAFESIELIDLIYFNGDDILRAIGDLSVADFVDFALVIAETELPEGIANLAVYQKVGSVTINDIVDGEAALEKIYSVAVSDIVDAFVIIVLNEEVPEKVKALSIYKDLGAITIGDMVNDPEGVLETIYLINLREIIEIVELFTELPDYNEFKDLMNNCVKVTLKHVIRAFETGDFEYILKTLLLSIDFSIFTDIPEASEAIDDKIESHNVFLAFESIELIDLIYFNADDILAQIGDLSVADFVDFALVIAETELPEGIANLAVYQKVGSITINDIVDGEAALEKIYAVTVGDIVDAFVIIVLNEEVPEKVKALSIYKDLGAITIGDMVNDPEGVLETIYFINLREIIEIVELFTELPDYNEFNDLMSNCVKVNIKHFITAAETGNYDYIVKTLLLSIDLSIFTDIPAVTEAIPDHIENQEVFKRVEAIFIVDIIYGNWDAIYESLADLTVGDIVDFVVACFGYMISDEVKALGLYSKLAGITIEEIVEDHEALLEKLYSVTLYDIIEVIMMFTTLPDYDAFNTLVENSKNVSIKDIVEAFEKKTAVYVAKKLLDKVDLSLFTDFPAVTNAIDDTIEAHKVFRAVESIEILDIVFMNVDDIMNAIGDISMADLVEFVLLFAASEVPTDVSDLEIYKKVGSITINDIVRDNNNALDKIYSVTVRDFLQIVELFYMFMEYDQLDKLLGNLDGVTVGEIVEAFENNNFKPVVEEALDGITLAIILDNPAVHPAIPDEIEAFKSFKAVKAVLVLDIIYWNAEAMMDTAYEIYPGEFIVYVFDVKGVSYKAYETTADLVYNVANISLGEIIETPGESVKAMLANISYSDIIDDIMRLAGVKELADAEAAAINAMAMPMANEGLASGTRALIEKISSNLEESYIVDTIFDPHYIPFRESIKDIDLGMIFNMLLDYVHVKNEKALECNAYKTIAAILVEEIIYDFDSALNKVLALTVGDVLDFVALLVMGEINPDLKATAIYIKLTSVTLDQLINDFDTVKHIFETITVKEVTQLINVYVDAENVTYAVDALIGNAVIYNVVTAQSYREAIEELFAEETVQNVYDVIAHYGVDMTADENVAYYTALFAEVKLADVFADPTPENIFTTITIADVLGPVLGWTLEGDKYVCPEGSILSDIADKLVSEFVSELFAGLHPYLITGVTLYIAANVVLICYLVVTNWGSIRDFFSQSISDILTQVGIMDDLGVYGEMIDTIIGSARPWYLVTATSYKAFIYELFGDCTVGEILNFFAFYHSDDYKTLNTMLALFETRLVKELLTDPSPAVIFGNITVGQLIGDVMGWTALNSEKTLWEGTGVLAPYANVMIVNIINSIPVIKDLHPYVQTAAIAAIAGAAVGLYFIWIDYAAPFIDEVLHMTILELFVESGVDGLVHSHPGSIEVVVLDFIEENFGNFSIIDIINMVRNGDWATLLGSVTIGEMLVVIDRITGWVTFLREFAKVFDAIYENVEDKHLTQFLAATTVEEVVRLICDDDTFLDMFDLVDNGDDTYILRNMIVVYDSVIEDANGDVYVVAEFIMTILKGQGGKIVGHIEINDIWDSFDKSHTLLQGVFAKSVYGFLDHNGHMTLSELIAEIEHHTFLEHLLAGVTVGDVLDTIGEDYRENMQIIIDMLEAHRDILVLDLIAHPEMLAQIAGETTVGEAMGYIKVYLCGFDEAVADVNAVVVNETPVHEHDESCEYKWVDANGNDVPILNAVIADLKFGDLLEGNVTAETILGDLTVGELVGLYYNEADDTWYADEEFTTESSVLMNAIAPVVVNDLVGGGEDVIMDRIEPIVLGELMGYVKDGDVWYTDETLAEEVDTVIGLIVDFTIGDFTSGTLTAETIFGDMLIGELMGYEEIEDVWFDTEENEAEVVMSKLCEVKVVDIMNGQFSIDTLLDGVLLGELLGYENIDDSWMRDGEAADSMLAVVLDLDVSVLMSEGLDLAEVFNGFTLGQMLGFTKDAETGEWSKDGVVEENAMLKALYEQDLGEVIENGLDIETIFGDMMLGEFMGYYKHTDNVWYTDETRAEAVNAVLAAIIDMKVIDVMNDGIDLAEALSDVTLGAMLGYTYTNNAWFDKDGNEVNILMDKLCSLYVGTIIEEGINLETLFNDVKLGQVLGYEFDGDKWIKDGNEAGAVETAIFNYGLGSMLAGEFDLNDIFAGMKLGAFMGYEYDEETSKWMNDGVEVSALMNEMAKLLVTDVLNGNADFLEQIQHLTIGDAFGVDADAEGLVGIVAHLTIEELQNPEELAYAIEEATIADIYPEDKRIGILALLDPTTKIGDIPNAVESFLEGATIGELMEAGIHFLTVDQVSRLDAIFAGTGIDFRDLTISQLIDAILDLITL